MSQEQQVTIQRRDDVLLIGLNRVAKRNAFDLEMLQALGAAYGHFERDQHLRCGVLFAHGDHFTAGLDLAQVAPALVAGQQVLREGDIDPWGLYPPLRTKPLICAVQGICYTLGIELMLAADMRVAAATTRFAQMEVRRGIYPFGGGTIRFVREAGWGNAMRYMLTGEEFSAQEALRIGLIQEVVEPGQQVERAFQLAQTVAAQAPLGVRAILASARLALREGEEAAIQRLGPDFLSLMQTQDAREGMQSFLERRSAHFQGH